MCFWAISLARTWRCRRATCSTPGTVTVADSQRDAYYGAVPVMLRYRLARRPTHRLHLDALLGATLLFSHYESSYRQTTNGQLQTDHLLELRSRNLFVTGGLGAGFDLTPHVELMLEGTANWNAGINEAQSPQKLMPGLGPGCATGSTCASQQLPKRILG